MRHVPCDYDGAQSSISYRITECRVLESNRKERGFRGIPKRRIQSNVKQVLNEPILKTLVKQSTLTETQLETLIIDLLVEDNYGAHIPYDDKAAFRSRRGTRARGVSRGAFNRSLSQARRNLTRCLSTMLLLAYLGLFEFTIFRPFEEIAGRIGNYRHIRDILGDKVQLTTEDVESYRAAERMILAALDELTSSVALKSDLSRRKSSHTTD
jgi:hypothetical protein